MITEKYVQDLLSAATARGCAAAEVCVTEGSDFSIGVLSGEPEDYSVSSSFALGLRVSFGGHDGYAYTEAVDDPDGLIAEAMDNASSVMSADDHPMQGAQEYPPAPARQNALSSASEREKIDLCLALEREAMACDPRVKRASHCTVATARGSFGIFNTLGLAAKRSDELSCCYVTAVMEENGEVKDGFAFRADGEAMDVASCAREAAQEAAAQLGAAPVPSGSYRAILRNDAAASLLAAFSPMFSADAAQKGLSLLNGREGERIAAECISVTDDPLNAVNPQPFDDEGTPSAATAVIERGVLRSLLHNLKTAKKAGVASTSNGGRGSAGSPVGVRPTNLYVEAGEGSLDELMARMGDGLVITDFSGMHAGVNSVSGRFSLLCKGQLVKAGRAARAVDQITISGTFIELMQSVEAAGADMRFSMPGGSCFGSPSLLLKHVSVSGDGAGE